MLLKTECGTLKGIDGTRCRIFLGVPFAYAERFSYAEPVTRWEGVFDATKPGPACPQNRGWHEHFEHPTRLFYHREFREGMVFTYDEDCLNLNIYAPKNAENAPVIVFFYGGGFDSGINWESPFEGSALAERGIITVFANYRIGILGYLCHAELKARYGREGNFGLDDQLTAVRWVKENIRAFGGDPGNITLMGQSAGAISTQYLCLIPQNKNLFRRAIMLSGAGRFPKFALPKPSEEARKYWLHFMETGGFKSFDELKNAPLDSLFDTVEKMAELRKDAVYYTMPVIDGVLLTDRVDKLIRTPLPVDYLIGFTNNDLYAPLMALIGSLFGKRNGAYIYYFDLDAPGDDNRAFHSADIRYAFGTLGSCWRPYGTRDYEASCQMMDYFANFARTGDPNGTGLPVWRKAGRGPVARVLCFAKDGTKMGYANYGTMIHNLLTKGEPKA